MKEHLKKGADPNYVSSQYGSCTPLHAACANNHPKVVEVLLEHEGTKIWALDRIGYTPLHYVCDRQYTECFKEFESQLDDFDG